MNWVGDLLTIALYSPGLMNLVEKKATLIRSLKEDRSICDSTVRWVCPDQTPVWARRYLHFRTNRHMFTSTCWDRPYSHRHRGLPNTETCNKRLISSTLAIAFSSHLIYHFLDFTFLFGLFFSYYLFFFFSVSTYFLPPLILLFIFLHLHFSNPTPPKKIKTRSWLSCWRLCDSWTTLMPCFVSLPHSPTTH